MDGYERKTAAKYEYAIPVTGEGNKTSYETVSQIPVKNHPSKMKIRKVEDGDSCVGNENGLLETDFQGLKEESGGLEEKILVNDACLLYTSSISSVALQSLSVSICTTVFIPLPFYGQTFF